MLTSNYFFCLVLLALELVAALPMSAQTNACQEASHLVKRMDGQDIEAMHDSSCLCLDCYARDTGASLPTIKIDQVDESITHPILKTVCYPITKPADFILNDCERDRYDRYLNKLIKKHRQWLRGMGVDPDNNPVTLRGSQATHSSGGSRRNMMPPQPMTPMDQSMHEIDLQVEEPPSHNAARRRPNSRPM